MCENILKRRGTFVIDATVLADTSIFNSLMAMFGHMVVLHCTFNDNRRQFEYAAMSPLFEVVEDTETPPIYAISVDNETLEVSVIPTDGEYVND